MNLTCTHCGKTFRITADQLGTRGKCPNCRATIILPRAANKQAVVDEITPPGLWMERWFSILGTVFLHVVILAILALIPYHDFQRSPSSQGEAVTIGPASQLSITSNANVDTQPERITADSSQRVVELFHEQVVSPSASSASTDQSTSQLLPGAGQQGEFENDSVKVFRGEDNGENEFEQLLARLQQEGLEIVITFDSTGSMEGEIEEVKNKIERMGSALFRMIPKTRIGICTYRDHDARYLVKGLPLSDDLSEVVRFLADISAGDGGDDPEAVQAGLEWSIQQNQFRDGARKVILLFGDSPPHLPDLDYCLRMASDFRRKQDGVISTVTCHRDERLPAFIEIAQMGGGEAFLARDEQEIMIQLMVLVFGSKHRDKVIEAFNMMNR